MARIDERNGWLPYWDDRYKKPLDHLPYWDDRVTGEDGEDEEQRHSPFVVEGDHSEEPDEPDIFEQAERIMRGLPGIPKQGILAEAQRDRRNLYGYSGSNPNAGLDPHGTDFIAIAGREVKLPFVPGKYYHYSLEYWQSRGPVTLRKEWKVDEFLRANKVLLPKKLAAVELTGDLGWKAWACKRAIHGRDKKPKWERKEGIVISYIVYSDTATKMKPIYQSPNPSVVRGTWRAIINDAKKYRWAEQSTKGVFSGQFKHWPDSEYAWYGTNSNTFVRYLLRRAKIRNFEMKGLYPGDSWPQRNDSRYVYGNQVPVKGELGPPPKDIPKEAWR